MSKKLTAKERLSSSQTRALNKAFDKLIASISAIYYRVILSDKEVFQFSTQSGASKRKATQAFREYRKETLSIISTSQVKAWELALKDSQKQVVGFVESLAQRSTQRQLRNKLEQLRNIPDTSKQLQEFQSRQIRLGTISDRVWDVSNIARQNIEIALTDALKQGMSAQELARNIKRNLRNPDALYRRVRDEHGRLTQSKAMRAYKPGQGVYKSAHQNALRLARTEINLAYGRAEQLYIEHSDDIVGQRIQTSRTGKNVCDLCDELQGDYPISFKFAIWHINCRCHRTFILKTDKEFLQEMRTGQTIKKEDSANYIKDIPEHFKAWEADNREKIGNRKSKPIFLSENGF